MSEEKSHKPKRQPTPTPVLRSDFRKCARPLTLYLPDAQKIDVLPTEFKTGSLGWGVRGMSVLVRYKGEWLRCRVDVRVMLLHSKNQPPGEELKSPPHRAKK